MSGWMQMLTSGQLRAARALLGIDQRMLAEAAGLSVPTIQRMEASDGVIRGNVDSLMKLVGALDGAGIELINEGAASAGGGRGLRMKMAGPSKPRGESDSPGASLPKSPSR
jgi:transcriptional regulator with XRE-family HTH domain